MLELVFTEGQLPVVKAKDRFPVLGGGERGGKSFATAAIALPHIIFLPIEKPEKFYKDGKLIRDPNRIRIRQPHFTIFGPHYKEPKEEFGLLEEWLRKLGMLVDTGINKPSKPDEGAWRMVTKQGVCITTWSLDDPQSVRSVDLEGAIVAEAGMAPYNAVLRINGRVSGTEGFIIYSGTMEDAQQWYQDWMITGERENHLEIRSYRIPTWTNNYAFPGGLENEEIKRLKAMYPDDIFAMRVAAEPRPPRLRVLKEFNTDIVQSIEIPEDADIELWVDPGYATAYAVLWVAIWKKPVTDPISGEEIQRKFFYVFDEVYEQGLITDDIIKICRKSVFFPHVRRGVMDVAGRGHRDASESAYDKWTKLASKISWAMKLQKEQPLIERIRTSAKTGQIVVSPKCRGLLAEAGIGEPVFPEMHPWKYQTDKDGRIISESPLDKWNHSSKALGYGLLNHLGNVEYRVKKTTFNRLKKGGGIHVTTRR